MSATFTLVKDDMSILVSKFKALLTDVLYMKQDNDEIKLKIYQMKEIFKTLRTLLETWKSDIYGFLARCKVNYTGSTLGQRVVGTGALLFGGGSRSKKKKCRRNKLLSKTRSRQKTIFKR
jgi:hypothetical protein